SYALFPNLTIEKNIAFGLENARRPKAEIQARVKELLALVGLSEQARKYPAQLSGGQRQRAFLAMVLAQDTPLILLDEPTTYLDINHQVELMRLMVELKRQGKTVVTVLHDLNQASRYCDHLVV
ncbi:ATP-binding cassette domain-containing protein, partial [Proteus mirabilis]|uniref:ATP-binding cassette domain-containing protein n=1 Tax=Proteus mirabilis TaxID=584 RepID=UPI001953C843